MPLLETGQLSKLIKDSRSIDRLLLAVTVCYNLSVIDCFLISMISITVCDTLPQHRSVSGARSSFSHSCTDHLSGQLIQLRCCVLTAVLSSDAGGCHKVCSALISAGKSWYVRSKPNQPPAAGFHFCITKAWWKLEFYCSGNCVNRSKNRETVVQTMLPSVTA